MLKKMTTIKNLSMINNEKINPNNFSEKYNSDSLVFSVVNEKKINLIKNLGLESIKNTSIFRENLISDLKQYL